MAFLAQVRLLLWKNSLLQRRKICVSVFEIIFPTFFAAILVFIKFLEKPVYISNPTYYARESIVKNALYNGGFRVEIGYTPHYPCLEPIMSKVASDFAHNATAVGFDTEQEMVDYYKVHSNTLKLAVVFSGFSNPAILPDHLTYFIRPYTTEYQQWHSKDIFPDYQYGPRKAIDSDYYTTGVLQLQALVGRAVIESWSSSNLSDVVLEMQRMPYPPYTLDGMILILQTTMMPAFIMFSFILNVIMNTKSIVYEKERKIKESMKLMGLMPAAHWASWFITYMIYLTVVMAMYTIFIGVSFTDNGPVLGKGDPSLAFFFFLMYAFSIVSFCFMISTFVQRANVAVLVSGLVYFVTYLPYIVLQSQYSTLTYSQKMAMGLLFNSAMGLGVNVFGLYLGEGDALTWSHISTPVNVSDDYSLLDAIIMLLVDTIIHLLVTWYVDNIYPGEFGVPKPFYFPFTKSYWCGSPVMSCDGFQLPDVESSHFEREPSLKTGISISLLKKEFGKDKIAVNDISLKMFEGQITVLLGHNGAGKSTTMLMLTGFIPPTSGTAVVNGYDIRTDIDSVRKNLGLCPQHDIFFDSLTVEEHLIFFAKLKGCPPTKTRLEVDIMLKDVGLEAKRHAKSLTLSGGQKRKLSVGIALIHGSQVVVLDEPTSGMDPAARRQTWDLLQRHRVGRTVLLTTHFMDEADILGDRIAIMADGVIKCCGSSTFLKKLYGTGYHLILVKGQDFNVREVCDTVQRHIPSAFQESEINTELSFLLPDDQSSKFPDLFRELEARKTELGIGGFGTTATTMEEVFLRVGENASSDAVKTGKTDLSVNVYENKRMESDDPTTFSTQADEQTKQLYKSYGSTNYDLVAFNRGYTKQLGPTLILSRMRAMVVKKALHTWRNRLLSFIQLLFPVALTVCALAINFTPEADQPLAFDLNVFGRTFVPYSNGSSNSSSSSVFDLGTDYAAQFAHNHDPEFVNLANCQQCWSNMSEYMLHRARQLTTAIYNKKMIIGAEFQPPVSNQSLVAIAYYNNQPYHAQPISVAALLNGLARHFAGERRTLYSGVNPLPRDSYLRHVIDNNVIFGYLMQMTLSFGMAFLTSSFVFFLVKERTVGAKHVQVMSGVGPGVFWASNFVWDFVNYLISCTAVVVVFAAFGTSAYVAEGRLGLVVVVFVLFGWAVLPFVYLFSFHFITAATALVVTIIFNIVSGFITIMTVFMLSNISGYLKPIGNVLNWIFLAIFPNHCFGSAFLDMYSNYKAIDMCANVFNYTVTCLLESGPCCKGYGKGCGGSNCLNFTENYMAWESPGIGRYLFILLLQGILFFGLILVIEFHLPQRVLYWLRSCRCDCLQVTYPHCAGLEAEDSDVKEERDRINSLQASDLCHQESLMLVNLYKEYGGVDVVNRLCVGVPEQECFGLLGQNGAGKTTTFKMLTGEVMAGGGNAYVNGFDIMNNIKKVQSNMGYCPQFDSLIDQMTGRETLTMYARLRGVPERSIKYVVSNLIDTMMLRPHADKLCSQYSGGNKRKLSTAIALVGDPSFILLDEPSSGMDPAAKRQLWNVLSEVRASGKTLVLTSHSMEECDALCTRIAIMVNGHFVCLGSPQHLKSKFGQGYTLIAKMKDSQDGMRTTQDRFISMVKSSFSSAWVFDDRQGYVHMQVPEPHVHLADVFTLMEKAKVEFNVQDYSVHQTTLEQQVEEGLLESFVTIVRNMMDRDYIKANNAYLEMEIGNTPWPIGVTMAIKRLMTQCQKLFPTSPSWSFNFQCPV